MLRFRGFGACWARIRRHGPHGASSQPSQAGEVRSQKLGASE
jgi:hypothetical protein